MRAVNPAFLIPSTIISIYFHGWFFNPSLARRLDQIYAQQGNPTLIPFSENNGKSRVSRRKLA
jgi:hypothetical protein